MKLLHTSDWHLGIRFLGKEREAEQQKVLNWIIETVISERIDLLIIAGDIFDTGTPSNSARKLYFSFLRDLMKTQCSHTVIIGGNHDSPSMLNAPAEILKELDIHIIGSAERNEAGNIDFEHEIISLNDSRGNPESVIAAVPFLRDRDLMLSMAGLEYDQRVAEIQKGIISHYEIIAGEIGLLKNIPLIATGHLFASGTRLSDNLPKQEGENDIHLGNLARIDFKQFADRFSYIALGHIHRPQKIGGCEHIRYSGSIVPMNFSERLDKKTVTIAEFDKSACNAIKTIEIPQTVELVRFKGTFEEIVSKINDYEISLDASWGEIALTEKAGSPSIAKLKEMAEEKGIEILKVSFDLPEKQASKAPLLQKSLKELSVDDIFEMRCQSEHFSEEEKKMLKESFNELKSWWATEKHGND